MASKTDDCGCGGPGLRTEQLLAGQVLGDAWKDIVEDILMTDGAERARAFLRDNLDAGDGDVLVQTNLMVAITYARDDETIGEKGLVSCVCTNDGVVCKCVGACNFDACCDPDGGTSGPIVAVVKAG
jgi:hypothetical protein